MTSKNFCAVNPAPGEGSALDDSTMEQADYISVSEAAELEGIGASAFLKRCERKRIVLSNDPEDRRRKLVPVSALSPIAQQRRIESQVAAALKQAQPGQGIEPAAAPSKLLQHDLPFAPRTAREQGILDAIPPGIPSHHRAYVERWAVIVGNVTNGVWKRHRGGCLPGSTVTIHDNGDYMRAVAELEDVHVSTIRLKRKLLREIERNPEIPRERVFTKFVTELVPKNRPGRSAASYFANPNNDWQLLKLREYYLNQARLSVKAAHRLLENEIDARQRAHGLGYLYEKPTLSQCRTALAKISAPELTLAREGVKAFNDKCAPYISRDYSSLHSNDLWVTDQRLVNVRLRGAGERLGRIWLVNFLDVASFKWLGFFHGPVLSSEVVMMAAAMALERWGVPGAVQMDLGKEFNCTAFNGSFRKLSGEALYQEAQGLWRRLGSRIVKAIGRNPQTKTIERWHHVIDDFDKNFPGWCGSNPDERPERLADEEAQHRAWLEGKAESTPLVTIEQYVRAFAEWAENDWNAQHRGRGKILQGLTPNEAWNTRRPLDGFRTLAPAEVEYQTAEWRYLKVARGGQVNLTFFGQQIEYTAPELFLRIGEEVEVIRSRRTLRQVTVIYPVTGGIRSCTAHAKPQFHWLSDDPNERDLMRQAMRCKHALRKTVKRGIAASHLALAAANPVALLESKNPHPRATKPGRWPVPDGPGPNGANEISGAEFTMEKRGRRMEFYNDPAEDAPAKKSRMDFGDVV